MKVIPLKSCLLFPLMDIRRVVKRKYTSLKFCEHRFCEFFSFRRWIRFEFAGKRWHWWQAPLYQNVWGRFGISIYRLVTSVSEWHNERIPLSSQINNTMSQLRNNSHGLSLYFHINRRELHGFCKIHETYVSTSSRGRIDYKLQAVFGWYVAWYAK